MPKDILRMFGPDSPSNQKPVATCGGICEAMPLAYDPPVGPKGIGDPKSPGIHGTNHGNAPGQGKH